MSLGGGCKRRISDYNFIQGQILKNELPVIVIQDKCIAVLESVALLAVQTLFVSNRKRLLQLCQTALQPQIYCFPWHVNNFQIERCLVGSFPVDSITDF